MNERQPCKSLLDGINRPKSVMVPEYVNGNRRSFVTITVEIDQGRPVDMVVAFLGDTGSLVSNVELPDQVEIDMIELNELLCKANLCGLHGVVWFEEPHSPQGYRFILC